MSENPKGPERVNIANQRKEFENRLQQESAARQKAIDERDPFYGDRKSVV